MTATTKHLTATGCGEVAHDHLAIRCPRLGGQVTFAYCRREAGALPCRQAVICWKARFPVDVFLKSVLTAADWDRWTHQSPKEKMVTLLELSEAAKERLQSEDRQKNSAEC